MSVAEEALALGKPLVITKVGRTRAGARLKELDLNPILAGPAGATAVDWLMVLN